MIDNWYSYWELTQITRRVSLVCENIVRFLRDFYEMILVGKFQSREIGEKCASRRSQIITQLYPINRNFTGSCCNTIVNLNAAPHHCCCPANPVRQRTWSCLKFTACSMTVLLVHRRCGLVTTPCRTSGSIQLSLGFLADVIFTKTTHTTPHGGTRRAVHSEWLGPYSSCN